MPSSITGRDKPIEDRVYQAGLAGLGAGVVYGLFSWAYYPDKIIFEHKNTIKQGPIRGIEYLNRTVFRPAVFFSLINMTFVGVESALDEFTSKRPDAAGPKGGNAFNTFLGGFASGIIMGGWYTRRFDLAGLTGLGVGAIMTMFEVNGHNVLYDEKGYMERHFPKTVPTQYEESKTLSGLKENYPTYKDN